MSGKGDRLEIGGSSAQDQKLADEYALARVRAHKAERAKVKPNRQPCPGPLGNTCGPVTPDTSPNPYGNSKPAITATPQEAGWWQRWGSDALHLTLDVVGLIPVVGELADGANAVAYLIEGDKANATLSALAMVPGAGMAATGAKLGKKAAGAAVEGSAKATRQAAEQGAKKEAAEEASEQAAKKSDGNGGGYDKGKKRMKETEVKCFKKNDKGDPNEYDRQLADQERGLNDLTVKEYLEGRKRFEDIGRKGTGAEQAKARAEYSEKLTKDYKTQLNKQGITGQAAQDQAAKMAVDKMSTLAALHNPDMIAGGKDVVTAMGDKGVNSSIGAQWKDRVAGLDKAAKDIPDGERGNTKMNAKLKRCK